MKKLSTKIAKRLKKTHAPKVVNFAEFKQTKDSLANEWSKLRDVESLVKEGHNPQQAVYTAAQNVLSLLIEILSDFRELDRHNKIVATAEDEYTPSWPPMSPISNSCFFTWSAFDVKVGIDKESYTTCLLDLRKALGLSDEMCRLFTQMASSRLGVYKVIEKIGDEVLLEELFDQKRYRCIAPSRHPFRAGELWLTRLLPPINENLETHVVFTSPYILRASGNAWMSFFDRNINKIKRASNGISAYESFMRYGLSNCYWLEFIMQGYSGHTDISITLVGLPDMGVSRPHYSDNHILPEMDLTRLG